MKFLSVAAALAACGFIPAAATAQGSTVIYVACMTHYGDNDRPSDVTPVARVSWPDTPATFLQLNSAYFRVMQKRVGRFYKAQCWGGDVPERAFSGLNQWEGMSGYAKRPRQEQPLGDIFPAIFDEAYQALSRVDSRVTRASFSAEAIGSVVDGAENASMERERAKSPVVEKEPEKLEIVAPSVPAPHRMTNAEADAEYAADMAEYKKAMAEHDDAVRAQQEALAAAEAQKARNAARAAAAQAAHDAEVAAAEAAKQAYREKYREATGNYPEQ